METEKISLMPATAESSLLRSLEAVSFPTLGHFLENGFADHRLRAMVPNVKVIGRAVTLKLLSPDATVARRVGVSQRTFDRRVRSVMDRLNAQTRFQAGVLAARRGWL